jgi:hypothetical protein
LEYALEKHGKLFIRAVTIFFGKLKHGVLDNVER